jgi:NADH:ubiquinone oxidoreductase subunit 4 (subunit M)
VFWKFEFTASTLQFSILIIRYGKQALFHHYPVSSTLFFILILGNLSLPGTLGFYGELFSILSLADVDFLLTALFV